jgi:virginiamycin B lyase
MTGVSDLRERLSTLVGHHRRIRRGRGVSQVTRPPSAGRRIDGRLRIGSLGALTLRVLSGMCLALVGCTSASSTTASSARWFENALASVQQPISELEPQAIVIKVGGAPHAPDWQADGFGSVWVSNEPRGLVQRIDTASNELVAAIPVKTPCAGMGAGFSSVWVPDCKDGLIARIDPSTDAIVAKIHTPIATDEGLIGVGEGGVWLLQTPTTLVMIDPTTNKITEHIHVSPGSQAAVVGFGSVWVASSTSDSVDRVDPSTGKVIDTIAVGPSPRFLVAGEGGVWVLNQGDGTVTHIDPSTNDVKATIVAQSSGDGGCIAAGLGAVWTTIPGAPLTRIDPTMDEVTEQFIGQGGDCLSVADGSLWLSNHDFGNVWRIQP